MLISNRVKFVKYSITMDSISREQEEYYEKCGELFLTIKGNIEFLCTLCEDRFKSFQDYNDHIFESHFAPDLKAELLQDFVNEADILDPLGDRPYSINSEEYSIMIENEEEPHDSPEILEGLDESPGEETQFQSLFEEDQTEEPDKFIMSEINGPIRPIIRSVNINPTIRDRKFKCPYCEFTCADRANIGKHIRRHSLNKPHECKECGKAFYTRTEVNVHMRLHTGERPFLCNLCGRSFTTSSKLNDHEKRHNNKRDKECPVCKIAFINSRGLLKHMVIHSDKRDYKCSECDASFKLPDALKNHMKLHENKRAYQCQLCVSNFNQHSGLYSHMRRCHTVVHESSKEI